MNASAKRLTTVRYPCDNAKIQMDLVDANPFWHPTMLIRRDALSVVGLYRSGIAEDYDLWLRIAERFQVANLEAVVLKYRVHPYQISVRSCRSQALGAIASQVAARARRSGEPDPLDGVKEITPAVLKELGASESVLHTALARQYLSCIRNMASAGESSSALKALEELDWSDFKQAAKWAIADFHLLWGHGCIGTSGDTGAAC